MKFNKAVLVNIDESSLEKKYWDELDKLVEKRVSLERSDRALTEELNDCDCLLLGFQVPINKDILDAAPNLKYIGVLATAYDTIDLNAATERDIPVCNLGNYSMESVAEFVIAVLLNEIRGLEEGLQRGRAADWSLDGIRAREIRGSNFGVIGLGNIGNRVAELAEAFGANVHYWSRRKKDVPYAYKDLDDLLSICDYISVNVAETPETIGLLNANNLPLLKPDSVLVSTVPSSIIDSQALVRRLSEGDIKFISDHAEDIDEDDLRQLNEMDNCILYPSIAFISDESRVARQETFISNIAGFLEGKIQNRIN